MRGNFPLINAGVYGGWEGSGFCKNASLDRPLAGVYVVPRKLVSFWYYCVMADKQSGGIMALTWQGKINLKGGDKHEKALIHMGYNC